MGALGRLADSPTFPSLPLRHSSFSNPSVALPTSNSISNPFVGSSTSQLILQLFFRFFYVTGSSLTSPGEPPNTYQFILTTSTKKLGYYYNYNYNLISLSKFNLPLYVTHATRALQSHNLSGEGVNFGSHTYVFDHTGTWRAYLDEGSDQCRGTSETART